MKKKIRPAASHPSFNESEERHFRVEVRPYNFKDICNIYQLGYTAMRTAIKPIRKELGKKRGYYYTVHQVDKIFDHMGLPYIREKPTKGKS